MPEMEETAEDRKRRERFEAERDVGVLREAREIRGDRKRMRRAMKMAQEQIKALRDTDNA